jgi:hypothetical protein
MIANSRSTSHESSSSEPTNSHTASSVPSAFNDPPLDPAEIDVEKIFFVLLSLGQALLYLWIVDDRDIKTAVNAVFDALAHHDFDGDIFDQFDALPQGLQYSATIALEFCASCYPIPIYNGFGANVLEEDHYGDPDAHNRVWDCIAGTIRHLASVRGEYFLFHRPLDGLRRGDPSRTSWSQERLSVALPAFRDIQKVWEKYGFPQPKPTEELKGVKIKEWFVPFATYGSPIISGYMAHDLGARCIYPFDLGRCLFAWTVRKRLNLAEGCALVVMEEGARSLVEWLEGLPGMDFTILSGLDLDWGKRPGKYKPQTKKFLKDIGERPDGLTWRAMVVIATPKADRAAESIPRKELR